MNFDVEIAEKQKQKQKLLNEMEIKKELFLEELVKYTIDWFEKETLSTIKANAEKVIDLGEDKAKELKGKIKELKERSPELVQRYMEEKSLWWHTHEDKAMYYSGTRDLLGKHNNQIKLIFGELGVIFIEYKIINGTSGSGHGWSYEGYGHDRVLSYNYATIFSDELYDINNGYVDLIKQGQKINEEIDKLEEKKKKENVEEWWVSL